ncbi:MAG: histidinol-phosphate transaminase [Rhodobacterales bacterium]|nr:histidinol-phosphate transaminase [Rhodobacterales bacterium]
MANKITPQPGILDIAVYKGGQSHLDGVSDVLKLSSNENPAGPGEKARAAFVRVADQLHRYPSTDHGALRAAIAEMHDLDADRIICGVGSDEILAFLCQAYAGPGDEVLYTEHGFGMYRIYASSVGATPVEVGETDRRIDVDKLLAACTARTRLVFIANPANPTGTMIDRAAMARLADGLPEQAILVLDGAYAEFADGYDGGAALVEARENVVMTRTFSKLYGLGGLRVGWGYGPHEIIDVLNRIKGPFNLSSPALETALAAVKDVAHVEKCRSDNARMREWLRSALAKHGVASDPSYANFILAEFGSKSEAEACDDFLKTQGIIVRRVAGYKLPRFLRITVGDEAGCRRVAHAIGKFKEGAK